MYPFNQKTARVIYGVAVLVAVGTCNYLQKENPEQQENLKTSMNAVNAASAVPDKEPDKNYPGLFKEQSFYFTNPKQPQSLQEANAEVGFLKSCWDTYFEARRLGNKQDSLAAVAYEKKLQPFQKKYFVLIRKAVVEDFNNTLWEENAGAKFIGKSEIRFWGSKFLDNKTKLNTRKELSDLLLKFRFTKISFQWLESDGEKTYWELSTPNDEAPVL